MACKGFCALAIDGCLRDGGEDGDGGFVCLDELGEGIWMDCEAGDAGGLFEGLVEGACEAQHGWAEASASPVQVTRRPIFDLSSAHGCPPPSLPLPPPSPFARRPLSPLPPRSPQKENFPLQEGHARLQQGPQGQTKHRQLPRLRLPEAVPPSLRQLLFIYQPSLEGPEQDRYSRRVVATYLARTLVLYLH